MVLSNAGREFILHWGEMGSRWGVNRTVAQVHALLYLSSEPLAAEDISEVLSVARSNVSTSLRELQNWQLVQTTPQLGDRRDFFTTSHDVWQLFQTVLQQRQFVFTPANRGDEPLREGRVKELAEHLRQHIVQLIAISHAVHQRAIAVVHRLVAGG